MKHHASSDHPEPKLGRTAKSPPPLSSAFACPHCGQAPFPTRESLYTHVENSHQLPARDVSKQQRDQICLPPNHQLAFLKNASLQELARSAQSSTALAPSRADTPMLNNAAAAAAAALDRRPAMALMQLDPATPKTEHLSLEQPRRFREIAVPPKALLRDCAPNRKRGPSLDAQPLDSGYETLSPCESRKGPRQRVSDAKFARISGAENDVAATLGSRPQHYSVLGTAPVSPESTLHAEIKVERVDHEIKFESHAEEIKTEQAGHGIKSETLCDLPSSVSLDRHVDDDCKALVAGLSRNQHSSMLRQPTSKPISSDQLAAEVKAIYAALVNVEVKCINLDNAELARQSKEMEEDMTDNAKWQDLIAWHRTLLYEHYDLLSASQHPCANENLKKLPLRYSMPARMWKHGIHSLLEVLRHLLPGSFDYMVQFIYIAYQMIGLLLETVPAFRETWIECLGDLARYRMAIEENDMWDREIWGGNARDWYSKVSLKHPDVGRPYHHQGILARMNAVQQLFLYCVSLTCVEPFLNARESLLALIGPIQASRQGKAGLAHVSEFEVVFLCLHGSMFKYLTEPGSAVLQKDIQVQVADCLRRLEIEIEHQGFRWRDQGAYMAVCNITACFQYGCAEQENPLALAYRTTKKGEKQLLQSWEPVVLSFGIISTFLKTVLHRHADDNVLGYVHIMLIFIWQVSSLQGIDMAVHLALIETIPWGEIVAFLNALMDRKLDHSNPYKAHPSYSGRMPGAALREDYLIRGLTWCRRLFTPDWFSLDYDDTASSLEQASSDEMRAHRMVWTGKCLVMSLRKLSRNRKMSFDEKAGRFSSFNSIPHGDGSWTCVRQNARQRREAGMAPVERECIKLPEKSISSLKVGYGLEKLGAEHVERSWSHDVEDQVLIVDHS